MKTISITGLDGCGKSTQAKLLKAALSGSRIVSVWDIIKRPEFQSWTIYQQPPKVENYVMQLHPLSRSLFIFHAFNEAYQKALNADMDYLIFDGHWYKYWAIERAMGAPVLLQDIFMKQYQKPDYSFYLKLPITDLLQRKKDISVYEGGDVQEQKLKIFSQIQQKAISVLQDILPENTISIDGRQSIDDIHKQIIKHLDL